MSIPKRFSRTQVTILNEVRKYNEQHGSTVSPPIRVLADVCGVGEGAISGAAGVLREAGLLEYPRHSSCQMRVTGRGLTALRSMATDLLPATGQMALPTPPPKKPTNPYREPKQTGSARPISNPSGPRVTSAVDTRQPRTAKQVAVDILAATMTLRDPLPQALAKELLCIL
jgi:hypothetical protein